MPEEEVCGFEGKTRWTHSHINVKTVEEAPEDFLDFQHDWVQNIEPSAFDVSLMMTRC